MAGENFLIQMQEAEKHCLAQGAELITIDGPTGAVTVDLNDLMSKGRDLYAEMSVAIFGEVTPQTRRACKNLIFRALYCGTKGTE